MVIVSKSLRSTVLTYGGLNFAVDARGQADLPEELATRLCNALPREYRPAGESELVRLPVLQDVQDRVRELEGLLALRKASHDQDLQEANAAIEAARFHIQDREEKLAAALARVATLEQDTACLPGLRRELAASQEQVQTILGQLKVLRDTAEEPKARTKDNKKQAAPPPVR